MAQTGTTIIDWIRGFNTGVLQTMFIIQKKAHSGGLRTQVASLIRLFQMLTFVLSTAPGVVFVKSTIYPVKIFVGLTAVSGYTQWFDTATYLGLYYFSLVWVMTYVLLFVWATISLMGGTVTVLWPLHLLRAIGTFSATSAFIPILTLLLSGFECGGSNAERETYSGVPEAGPQEWWAEALSGQCFVGGHLAQTVISAILTAAFIILCSLFAFLAYDGNPLSVSLASKSSGRTEVLFVLMKIVMVIVVKTWPAYFPAPVILALYICSGLFWMGLYLATLPFYHHTMNRIQVAMAAVYTLAGVCAAIGYANPSADLGVTFYVGILPIAYVGARAADVRAKHIMRSQPDQLNGPYEFELRARYIVFAVLFGDPLRSGALSTVEALSQSTNDRHADGHGAGAAALRNHRNRSRSAGQLSEANGGADEESGGNNSQASASDRTALLSRSRAELEAEDDTQRRAAIAQSMLPHEVLIRASNVLKAGAARFRHSSIIHVFMARFYGTFMSNKHMQMSHLLQAERRHPALDVRYAVFAMRKVVEENTGGDGAGQLSALSRVAFEKYLSESKKATMDGLSGQVELWTELQADVPDITKLHSIAQRVTTSISAAESAFTTLLRLNPRSLLVLRLFASFKLHVCNDPDKASMLISEAERMEEQQSKETGIANGKDDKRLHLMAPSQLDVMADATGIITIGGAQSNLGLISTASAFACRLFGYTSSQLERRNISTLLPQPIARMHDSYLRRYLQTGEGSVVDYTRVVFGLHRQGHIFPLLLAVREAPASHGEPAFVGLVRSIVTTEDYILLNHALGAPSAGTLGPNGLTSPNASRHPTYGDRSLRGDDGEDDGEANVASSLTITTATIRSLAALGIDAATAGRGDQRIVEWIPALASPVVMRDLLSDRGATLRITLPAWLEIEGEEGDEDVGSDGGNSDAGNSYGGDMDVDAVISDSPANKSKARGGSVSRSTDGNGSSSRSSIWVHAYLQHVPLPGAPHFYVLSWTPMATDAASVRHAETYEAKIMGTTMPASTTVNATQIGMAATMTSPLQSRSVVKPAAGSAAAAVRSPVPDSSKKAAPGTAPSKPRNSQHGPQTDLPSGHPAVPAGASSAGCPAMVNLVRPASIRDAATSSMRRNSFNSLRVTTDAKHEDASAAKGGAHHADGSAAASAHVTKPTSHHKHNELQTAKGARAASELQELSHAMQARGIDEESGGGLNMRLRMLRSISTAQEEAALSPTAALFGTGGGAGGGHGSTRPGRGLDTRASEPGALDVDTRARDLSSGRPSSVPGHIESPSAQAAADRAGLAVVGVDEQSQLQPRRSSVRFSAGANDHPVTKPSAVDDKQLRPKNEQRQSRNSIVNAASAVIAMNREKRNSQIGFGGGPGDSGRRGSAISRRDGDERGSYRGSQASSTKTSGRKMATWLRKVVDSPNQPLEPGLKRLFFAALSVTVIGVALAIGLVAFAQNKFSYSDALVNNVVLSGDTLDKLCNIQLTAGTMLVMSKHWGPNWTEPFFKEIQQDQSMIADAMLSQHRALYAYSQSRPEFSSTYIRRDVQMSEFYTSGLDGQVASTITTTSLYEAGIKYVAAAKALSALPPANISSNTPEAQATAVNGWAYGPTTRSFNASSYEWLRQAYASSNQSIDLFQQVFYCMMGILGGLTVIVFLPIAYAIESQKLFMMHTFVALPPIVLNTLREQTNRRLHGMRTAEMDEDDDEDNEDGAAGDGDGSESGSAAGKGGTSGVDAVLEYDPAVGEVDWDRLIIERKTLRELEKNAILDHADSTDTSWGAGVRSWFCMGSQPRGNATRSGNSNGAKSITGSFIRQVSGSKLVTAPPAAQDDSKRRKHNGRMPLSPFVPRPSRPYKRSILPSLISSARFFVPLVFLAAYFALLYVESTTTLDSAMGILVLSSVANSRLVLLTMATGTLRKAARTPGSIADPALNTTVTAGYDVLDRLDYFNKFLNYARDPSETYQATGDVAIDLANRVAGCDSECPILSADTAAALHQMVVGDACSFLQQYGGTDRVPSAAVSSGYSTTQPSFDVDSCRSWRGGLMTRGLSTVLHEYIVSGRRILDRRSLATTSTVAGAGYGIGYMNTSATSAVTVPYSNDGELTSADVYMIMDGGSTFIVPCLRAAQQLYVRSVLDQTQLGGRVLTIVTGSCMSAFVLFMLLIYMPALRRSNTELQKQRALLLLLPVQVVQTSPTIQAIVDDILHSAGVAH